MVLHKLSPPLIGFRAITRGASAKDQHLLAERRWHQTCFDCEAAQSVSLSQGWRALTWNPRVQMQAALTTRNLELSS